MLNRLLSDERGATAIEYALIASLISTIILAALMTMGTSLGDIFNTVGNSMSVAHS